MNYRQKHLSMTKQILVLVYLMAIIVGSLKLLLGNLLSSGQLGALFLTPIIVRLFLEWFWLETGQNAIFERMEKNREAETSQLKLENSRRAMKESGSAAPEYAEQSV